jgi:hypothetical protein
MEFNSAEFFRSSEKERISKCRAFAAEAERLGRAADGNTREGYFELAKRWAALADEMEAVADGEVHG